MVCLLTLSVNYITLCNTTNDSIVATYKLEQESKQDTILKSTKYKLLAKVINSESHGESFKSKLHVGSVVLNRTKDSNFPNTIKKVIYQRNQFDGIGTKYFRFSNKTKDDVDSKRAALYLLMNGSINDDILYFHNPDIVNKRVTKILVKVDKQIFY